MSSQLLLDKVSATTTANPDSAKTILNNNGIVTIGAFGFGTTFSATVNIYPVFAYEALGDPITLSLSNTTPVVTQTINTPHSRYIAVLSALTGAGTITVSVEG